MLTVHAADWVVPVVAPPLRDGAVAVDDAGAIVEVAPRDGDPRPAPAAPRSSSTARRRSCPASSTRTRTWSTPSTAGSATACRSRPGSPTTSAASARSTTTPSCASAMLGAEASLRTGVTCVADCAFAGATAGALRATGLRGTVYLEAFGAKGADPAAVAGGRGQPPGRPRPAGGPLVRLGVSPHAPYTVAPPVYAALLRLARERGLPVATHVAESAAELEALTRRHRPGDRGQPRPLRGRRPRRAPDRAPGPRRPPGPGRARDPRRARRARGDRAAGRDSGSPVAHCPRSNAVLGCGVAPVGALRAAGVTVGLGTDSPSSAIDLDSSPSCGRRS